VHGCGIRIIDPRWMRAQAQARTDFRSGRHGKRFDESARATILLALCSCCGQKSGSNTCRTDSRFMWRSAHFWETSVGSRLSWWKTTSALPDTTPHMDSPHRDVIGRRNAFDCERKIWQDESQRSIRPCEPRFIGKLRLILRLLPKSLMGPKPDRTNTWFVMAIVCRQKMNGHDMINLRVARGFFLWLGRGCAVGWPANFSSPSNTTLTANSSSPPGGAPDIAMKFVSSPIRIWLNIYVSQRIKRVRVVGKCGASMKYLGSERMN